MPPWLPFVLPGLTAGLIAATGVSLKAAADRRNPVKRYESALARAKIETEVITAWIQAYRLVVGDGSKIRQASTKAEADLDTLYSQILAARHDLERAKEPSASEMSPHYAMATFALIFFQPTGIVAVTYCLLTRRAAKAESFTLARRRSSRVVLWFWISVSIGATYYVIALFASSS